MKTLSVDNLLFVDLPEGTAEAFIPYGERYLAYHSGGINTLNTFLLPPGTWEAVGFVRELTEEQKKLYMEANRVYLKNPLGEKEPERTATSIIMGPMQLYGEPKQIENPQWKQWHQYQERVLPNAFLLIRNGG